MNFCFAWQYKDDGYLESAHTKDVATAWWLLTQLFQMRRLTINCYRDGEYTNTSVIFENGVEIKRIVR